MKRFLMFETLIAPWIIRVVAWVAAVVVFLGGLKTLITGDFPQGILLMFGGPVAVRLLGEVLLVPFMIHARLVATETNKPS